MRFETAFNSGWSLFPQQVTYDLLICQHQAGKNWEWLKFSHIEKLGPNYYVVGCMQFWRIYFFNSKLDLFLVLKANS